MSDEQLRSLRRLIEERSNHLDSNDFWIDDRPFILIPGTEYEGQLEEYTEVGLCDLLGWTVEATVTVCAMCNQIQDHRLLGEFCLNIAKLLGGIIDFGGELPLGRAQHRGALYGFPQVGNSGCPWTWHIGDIDFLAWWLEQPNFRLVK